MSAINAGAYLCPGADVLLIDERHGNSLVRILNIDTGPGGEAIVTVLDPGGNPFRREGQRVTCTWRELRVPARRMWPTSPSSLDSERFPAAEVLEAERHGLVAS
ncbi:MAG TPA: hypothetical protein VFC19_49495 [Candidatus Limnocylindrales bacterium]|nr:hypothetical protein [Candidatus Limnocylindrales bacterium]